MQILIVTQQSSAGKQFAALDLPTSMSLSYQRSSPFFTEEGSYTLPLTLPDTDHNRDLLQFANRLDITRIGQNLRTNPARFSCLLQQSAVTQPATLLLLSYTPSEGFECSLLLNETNLRSELKDITLKQVLQYQGYSTPTSTPAKAKSIRKAKQSNDIFTPDDTDQYKQQRGNGDNEDAAPTLATDIFDRLHSSSTVQSDEFEVFPVFTPRGILNDPGRGPVQTQALIDGEQMQGPEGLMFTVFLHLDYVLRCIFAYTGRTLNIQYPEITDESGITFSEAFRHIVILNQTIDALVPGRIYYDTLVPDTPCLDLLQGMFALFGAAFIEETDGTVTMRFLQDILTEKPTFNTKLSTTLNTKLSTTLNTKLSTTLNTKLSTLNYQSPQRLTITPEHIRHETDADLTDWQQLLREYNIPADGIKAYHTPTYEEKQDKSLAGQIMCKRPEGMLYALQWREGSNVLLNYYKETLLGSAQMDGYELTEQPSDDTEQQSINCPIADTRPADTGSLPAVQAGLRPLHMPLMPGLRNETCTVTQTITTDDGEGNQTTEDKDLTLSDDCPLCLCFSAGTQTYSTQTIQRGSPLNLLSGDNTQGIMFDLNQCGMPHTMLAAYQQALLAGAHQLTVTAFMTKQELHDFRFDRTYIVEGIRCLPLKLETQTTPHQLQQVTLTLIKI